MPGSLLWSLLAQGETPLDAATLEACPDEMGAEMVLVGGQALAFWMDRYGLVPALAAITHDGDALGTLAQARRLARRLHAALLVPQAETLTSLAGQIRIPAGEGGKVRNVDLLHLLYTVGGLRQSREFTRAVWRDSVQIVIRVALRPWPHAARPPPARRAAHAA
jgi:hypothetical protein